MQHAGTMLPRADAAWLHMDRPTNLMVITAALWFDEPVDWTAVEARVRARLVDRFPRFRARIVEPPLGLGACRLDPSAGFDLAAHLHPVRLDPPGTLESLQTLVGHVMATPLDRRRPLWELYLVDGLDGGSAIVARLHHCLADGITLARVLLSLTDREPDAGLDLSEATARPDRPAPRRGASSAVRWASRTAGRLAQTAASPKDLGRAAGRAATALRSGARMVALPPDHRSVLKGRMGPHKRAAWTSAHPLAEVKATGRALGGTVNDVALAAISGALHRYLARRDSLVPDVRALVPFNLRPLDQPVPLGLGNRFGLVFLALPVGLGDPVARLRAVCRRMQAIKRSPDGPVSFAILSAIGLLPVPLEARVVDLFASKASAVITNVPGPTRPVYLAGHPLRGLMAWVPASGHIGLGVSILSYDGALRIGVAADARLVPDAGSLVEDIESELGVLRRIAAHGRAPLAAEAAPAGRSPAPPPRSGGDGAAGPEHVVTR